MATHPFFTMIYGEILQYIFCFYVPDDDVEIYCKRICKSRKRFKEKQAANSTGIKCKARVQESETEHADSSSYHSAAHSYVTGANIAPSRKNNHKKPTVTHSQPSAKITNKTTVHRPASEQTFHRNSVLDKNNQQRISKSGQRFHGEEEKGSWVTALSCPKISSLPYIQHEKNALSACNAIMPVTINQVKNASSHTESEIITRIKNQAYSSCSSMGVHAVSNHSTHESQTNSRSNNNLQRTLTSCLESKSRELPRSDYCWRNNTRSSSITTHSTAHSSYCWKNNLQRSSPLQKSLHGKCPTSPSNHEAESSNCSKNNAQIKYCKNTLTHGLETDDTKTRSSRKLPLLKNNSWKSSPLVKPLHCTENSKNLKKLDLRNKSEKSYLSEASSFYSSKTNIRASIFSQPPLTNNSNNSGTIHTFRSSHQSMSVESTSEKTDSVKTRSNATDFSTVSESSLQLAQPLESVPLLHLTPASNESYLSN